MRSVRILGNGIFCAIYARELIRKGHLAVIMKGESGDNTLHEELMTDGTGRSQLSCHEGTRAGDAGY